MSDQQTGAEAIAAERQRQIDVEGYTPEHDAGHYVETYLEAAEAYIQTARGNPNIGELTWPWELATFKPTFGRRDLVKAGALIAAAIDRFDAHEAARS